MTLFRQPNTDTEQELIAHVLIVSLARQTWPVCFCGPRGHCPSIMCFVSTRQSLLLKCSSSPQQTRPRECFRNPQRAQRRSSLVQHKHVFYSISFVCFFYISDVALKAAPPDSRDVSDNFGNGERSLPVHRVKVQHRGSVSPFAFNDVSVLAAVVNDQTRRRRARLGSEPRALRGLK